jgi:hypothetical protein
MKISHSIIVLTSIILVTGSMISVGMDLKKSTDNVSINVVEAKYKHTEVLRNAKKTGEKSQKVSDKEYEANLQKHKMNKQKTVYKLKSLNQQSTSRSTSRFL